MFTSFIGFLATVFLVMYVIWCIVVWFSNGEPLPIWFHKYFLGREVRLVKDRHSAPYKVVVRKDPFGDVDFGYRYHHTKIGVVSFYQNGKAEYCGDAKWIKV